MDGTYHLVASGSTSWCGFARAIFERSTPFQGKGVARQRGEMPTGAPRITAIATADYPTKAVRPAYSVLDTSKLRETFGIELPDWQSALDDVMEELARS